MIDEPPFAELHCHTNFSFLNGASTPDELIDRAVALGLSGLAITDHQGLYGVVRFASAAEAAGIHPVIGVEIELIDAAVPDPGGLVIPARARTGRGSGRARGDAVFGGLGGAWDPESAVVGADGGLPARPRPTR